MLGLSSAGDGTKGFMCDAYVLDIYYILRAFSEALYMTLLTTFKSMCGMGTWSCSSFFIHGPGMLPSQALCYSRLTFQPQCLGFQTGFCQCKWTYLLMSRLLSWSPFHYMNFCLCDSMPWVCISLDRPLLLGLHTNFPPETQPWYHLPLLCCSLSS